MGNNKSKNDDLPDIDKIKEQIKNEILFEIKKDILDLKKDIEKIKVNSPSMKVNSKSVSPELLTVKSRLNSTESKRSKDIDKELNKDKEKLNREIKVLFLGPLNSGKTTLFKQLQIIYTEGLNYVEYKDLIKNVSETEENSYFTNNKDRIENIDYIPTNEDILNISSNNTETRDVTIEDLKFINIGKTDKKKILNLFYDVNFIIFVASLTDDVNDILNNYKNTVETFPSIPICVFLNKFDLLNIEVKDLYINDIKNKFLNIYKYSDIRITNALMTKDIKITFDFIIPYIKSFYN